MHDAGVDTLYVRLRGAVAAVEAACRSMGGERQDNARVAADWAACRDQTLPWFTAGPSAGLDLWRLSLPATTPCWRCPAAWRRRWSSGTARCAGCRPPRSRTGVARRRTPGGRQRFTFRAHSADAASVAASFDPLPAGLQAIHERLRQSFDPAGIFNPGRMAWQR